MSSLIQWVRTLPRMRDGEEVRIPARGKSTTFMHECCDCGAEHKVEVKFTGKNFIMKFWKRK